MDNIVKYLKNNHRFISTMESCTGGYLASSITNVSGSSLIFKFGAVTYSNEFKMKMGVDKEIIDKYSVYSMECAQAMSRSISIFTDSDYGVGITGKINEEDPNNPCGDNSTIYLSIYEKEMDRYYNKVIQTKNQKRELNKELVKKEFICFFEEKIIKKNK